MLVSCQFTIQSECCIPDTGACVMSAKMDFALSMGITMMRSLKYADLCILDTGCACVACENGLCAEHGDHDDGSMQAAQTICRSVVEYLSSVLPSRRLHLDKVFSYSKHGRVRVAGKDGLC